MRLVILHHCLLMESQAEMLVDSEIGKCKMLAELIGPLT